MQPFEQQEGDQGCPIWMRKAFSVVPTKLFTVRFCFTGSIGVGQSRAPLRRPRQSDVSAYLRRATLMIRKQ
jgi:hypothetical protein